MIGIIEQVREGLIAKIEGIQNALPYVKDPREIERLQNDLSGAEAALKKLNEKDTRTEEELKEIEAMIESAAQVDTPADPWTSMTPIEKFQYQVKLYYDKLKGTAAEVSAQRKNLSQVLNHLVKTKGDAAMFMNPVIGQFQNSLAEVDYSKKSIDEQLKIADQVLALIEDEDFFDDLVLLNRFLNNPMSLPHLSEEKEKQIKELRGEAN